MRPTVDSKHRRTAEKIAADTERYLREGGKVSHHEPHERARPPVDHWSERVTEDYRIHEERRK